VPSLLLAFPVFHSKGPQNIDLFNLTTPSVSLTGAEVVPKVKEEPVAGWNGDRGLQTAHPGSKPSLLLPAPCWEGAGSCGHAGKRRLWGVPQTVAGKVTLVPREPAPGCITTAAGRLSHFCKEPTCPAWCGRGEERCGTERRAAEEELPCPGTAAARHFSVRPQ